MNKENNIRYPAVAGQFYPDSSTELQTMIVDFIKQAEEVETTKPRILIVPHAGYVYSGAVAAQGYKAIQNQEYKRVILLGASHNFSFSGAILDDSDVWETPLGQVNLDKQMISSLITNDLFSIDAKVHQSDHSLEVQLPFLQTVLSNEFTIVPIFIGSEDWQQMKKIGEILADYLDNNTLLVISSDLSHYPEYNVASRVDQELLASLSFNDPVKFIFQYEKLEKEDTNNIQTFACGRGAIVAGLEVAKKFVLQSNVLKYANSGDVEIGDKNQVVGYGAVIFSGSEPQTSELIDNLSDREQEIALQFSRQVLNNYFFNQEINIDLTNQPIFQTERRVFVTLRTKSDHQLKGCIGNVVTQGSLADNIRANSLAAALDDPRFVSVTASELEKIGIEISVLSPFHMVASAEEIELGKHGVMVKQGDNTGLFLPQVALETGWTKEEFLGELCNQKAGLAKDCWQSRGVELYVFTAQIFSE